MTYKAVFLDQDGTLVPRSPNIYDSAAGELHDDVVEGLQRLQSYGYLLIVVSNKSEIAHGKFTMDDCDKEKGSLYDSCAHLGIYLDGCYQKGNEQNLRGACEGLNIDVANSWMVGDTLNDVEAGNKAGCKSIMINNGNEKSWTSGAYRLPEYFARNLAEASRYIVATDNMKLEEAKVEREKAYAYSSATSNQ